MAVKQYSVPKTNTELANYNSDVHKPIWIIFHKNVVEGTLSNGNLFSHLD